MYQIKNHVYIYDLVFSTIMITMQIVNTKRNQDIEYCQLIKYVPHGT